LGIELINNSIPKLVDLYSLLDVNLFGIYKASYSLPEAPLPNSDKTCAEMIELYAMYLLRYINLSCLNPIYFTSTTLNIQSTINQIINYLNQPNILNYLGAPLESGQITPNTLFRCDSSGDLIGPYVSQFLYFPVGYGQLITYQTFQLYQSNIDVPDFAYVKYPKEFMNNTPDFLNVWNGNSSTENINSNFNINKQYISSLGHAGMFIYNNQVWQIFHTTAVQLLNNPRSINGYGVPIGYQFGTRQGVKFVNLGPVDLFDLLSQANKLAIETTWVWKWNQLRMRPEELAYQIDLKNKGITGAMDFSSNLLTNNIFIDVSNNNGNCLLPSLYPNGSPFNPSYPSGQACVASAMALILKAWFNCDSIFQNGYITPVNQFFVTGDLEFYNTNLKIEHEINKLASNCGMFGCFAGTQYRSDVLAGLQLGENIGIQILKNWVNTYDNDIIFRFRLRNGSGYQVSKDFSGPYFGTIYTTTPVTLVFGLTLGAPSGTPNIEEVFSDANLS
jgi:hypothetical protein